MLLQRDLEAIKRGYTLIRKGNCSKIDLGCGITMYKVPYNNSNNYTIRLDIKVKEDE